LWTAAAGYNQDVGLFVSVDGGADRQLAWKESGGFAGTYSPNAAFVQFAYSTQPGHNYRFKLKWKPNVAAPAGTLYAGAGTSSSGFSPTRLTVEMVAPGNLSFLRAGSSYSLGHDNDGGTWVELSPTVRTSLRPARNALGIVGGNIDLWTSQPGYNQD